MNTNLRITGLASGIDTESMIEQLMEAEKTKVNKVKQQKQLLVWRQEMYNDLNKEFANFILNTKKELGLISSTSNGTLVPNSYRNLSWVMKATSSDTSKATVSASTNTLAGSYKVNVKQLAEGVSIYSGSKIVGDELVSDVLNISDSSSDGETVDSKIEFRINGKRFLIGDLETNEDGIVYEEGKYIDKEGYLRQKVEDGEDIYVLDGEDKIRFDVIINKDFSSATMKDVLSDLTKEINNTEGIGVKASYDSNYGVFFLNTVGTGRENSFIEITAGDNVTNANYFFGALNLKVKGYIYDNEQDAEGIPVDDTFNITDNKKYQGIDAEFAFNGIDGLTSPTNNITINGISMNIAEEGEFTVNVSTDVDSVYEKIKGFVDEYNKLVDKASELLFQKRYYDYAPLTEEQKKEMEESEIKLWEEKAKSGLLRNDDIISRIMQKIRSSLYEGFEGAFSLITQIGITTEKYSSGSAGGRLEIDEKKLKEAISKAPNGVMELLFEGSSENSKGGIVNRIYDNLIQGMEEIIKKSGTGDNSSLYRNVKSNILVDFVSQYGSISLLDKDITDFNERIDELNDELVEKESYYYNKFAAMESYINQMNAQSMWLAQQFSNN